jgi:hypothetical protein
MMGKMEDLYKKILDPLIAGTVGALFTAVGMMFAYSRRVLTLEQKEKTAFTAAEELKTKVDTVLTIVNQLNVSMESIRTAMAERKTTIDKIETKVDALLMEGRN